MLKELKTKILNKKAKIGIIGLGYVGLPLAITFAKKGFKVYGIDVDKNRIAKLNRGESYILDVPNFDVVKTRKEKTLIITEDFSIIKELDVVIICVPTPLHKTKEPDVSYIVSAVENIKKYMKRGQIIILESTTYPGTTQEVMLPVLESTNFKEGKDFYLAFSPERIDPGNAKFNTANTPKIIGGISKESTEIAKVLYEQVIEKVIPVSSSKVAEMVKLLENTFRIVNIGLVNEIMLMCDKLGIDVWEVIDAAKTKPYGFMPFYPGPGVGGHCLSKDEYVFIKDNDNRLKTVKISDFVKEEKNDPNSKIHNLRGVTFIKPFLKETFSYDVISSIPCFKPIRILSERPYIGDMVTVKTQDNRIFSVTSKHPVIVCKNNSLGIKFADELEVNEEIPCFFNNINLNRPDIHKLKLSKTKIVNIAHSKGIDKVYSMEISDTNTFVTSYGILTHNCIPIDPIYLSWKARGHGFEARFIDLASHVNSEMPHYVVEKIINGLNEHKRPLNGAKVLIVGIAYKRDVKDLRESPALEIIGILQKKGAIVSYYDPYLPFLKWNGIDLKCVKFNKALFKNADCVVIVTDHSNVDYKFIAENSKLIIDTRNILKGIKKRSNIIKL